MKNNYRVIIIYAVVFLLFFSFLDIGAIAQSETIKNSSAVFSDTRVIVLLDQVSVSDFSEKLVLSKDLFSGLKEKVSDYRDYLLNIQDLVKSKILGIINVDDIFGLSFTEVLNGFVLRNIPEWSVDKIKKLDYVKDVVIDREIKINLDESVPIVNADNVWNLNDSYGVNVTGSNISIAIIDTGVDYNHPDLVDAYVGGYNFINENIPPLDDNGHGTHCASIALGRGNASGSTYVGVAPSAKLYAYKVVDDTGSGFWSDSIAAMEQAVIDDVDIISMSFGTDGAGDPDDALSEAADNAVKAGVTVVAAAGNSGPNDGTVSSPGVAHRVICVGSSTKNDDVYLTSSRGPVSDGTVKPDLVAPGVSIVAARADGTSIGTVVNEYYTRLSGTSMATPHVAGAVALIKQMHPNWSAVEIKMALRNNAVDVGEDIYTQGYGRLDVLNSVNLSDVPGVAVLNTSGELETGVIDIIGTANASYGFENYSVYYENQDDEWVLIYKNSSMVSNGVLARWDTRVINGGTYKLKLVVRANNQVSVDYVNVHFEFKVLEGESFTITITDQEGRPTRGWVLMTMPFHIPRLKYGSSVTLTAPIIFNPNTKEMTANIRFFKILGFYRLVNMKITVVNK